MSVKFKKLWLVLGVMTILTGCVLTNQSHSIPVVDAGSPLSNKPNPLEKNNTPVSSATDSEAVAQAVPQVVEEPIQSVVPQDNSSSVPTGIPSADGSTNNTPLDGAVLALLTTSQQQQEAGNLNEAAASAERAQRIAPSEPRVLYSLAMIRLKQGDAEVAEQLARRALSYTTNDQSELRSNLWEVIAQAREKQGDQAGAAQARQQKTARV